METIETLILAGMILSQAGVWYKIGRFDQRLKEMNGYVNTGG